MKVEGTVSVTFTSPEEGGSAQGRLVFKDSQGAELFASEPFDVETGYSVTFGPVSAEATLTPQFNYGPSDQQYGERRGQEGQQDEQHRYDQKNSDRRGSQGQQEEQPEPEKPVPAQMGSVGQRAQKRR